MKPTNKNTRANNYIVIKDTNWKKRGRKK